MVTQSHYCGCGDGIQFGFCSDECIAVTELSTQNTCLEDDQREYRDYDVQASDQFWNARRIWIFSWNTFRHSIRSGIRNSLETRLGTIG